MRTKPRVVFMLVVPALISMACLGATATGGATGSPPTATPQTATEPATATASVAAPTPTASPVTYATPEDAITAYFDGVAHSNMPAILQPCAVDEMAEKFRFDLYTAFMGGYLDSYTMLAPSNDAVYVEANRAELTAQIAERVKVFDYSLLSSQIVVDGSSVKPITGLDAAGIDAFVKAVDPAPLTSLTVEKIAAPEPGVLNSDQNKQNFAKLAAIYGADEMTERVALLSFEGKEYLTGFSLLRYGAAWKIRQQISNLAGTNAEGAAQPTTASDFQDLTTP